MADFKAIEAGRPGRTHLILSDPPLEPGNQPRFVRLSLVPESLPLRTTLQRFDADGNPIGKVYGWIPPPEAR